MGFLFAFFFLGGLAVASSDTMMPWGQLLGLAMLALSAALALREEGKNNG